MTSLPTITCQQIVELMTEYLEGALGDADRHLFERHLVQCPPCRDYLQQLRATLTEARKLVPGVAPELSADTEAALLATFRSFKRGRSSGDGT